MKLHIQSPFTESLVMMVLPMYMSCFDDVCYVTIFKYNWHIGMICIIIYTHVVMVLWSGDPFFMPNILF